MSTGVSPDTRDVIASTQQQQHINMNLLMNAALATSPLATSPLATSMATPLLVVPQPFAANLVQQFINQSNQGGGEAEQALNLVKVEPPSSPADLDCVLDLSKSSTEKENNDLGDSSSRSSGESHAVIDVNQNGKPGLQLKMPAKCSCKFTL